MPMLTLTVAWVLVNVLLQGATPQQSAPAPPSAAASTPFPVTNWKVALMAGDDSIPAFDDARKTLKEILLQDGISADHIKELSMDPAAQVDGVLPGGYANLLGALDSLNIGGGDSCLVYMTSHGNRQGFAIKNNPPLTPAALNSIVEHSCGGQPTVLLISACYSGVFVHDVMLKPNRIILTAARDDRSSFGCAPQNEYTDWDRCVIDNLPSADTWQSLYGSVSRCVQTRESEGHFTPSIPQGFFGNEVAELKIPSLTRSAIGVAASQCPVSGDDGYGFSAANAIKVGLDDATGPARERKYLNALRGPAGQRLSFRRVGSTVTADKTILDLYEITYDGIPQPIRVYLDEYHFEDPKAPKGMACGIEIGLKK